MNYINKYYLLSVLEVTLVSLTNGAVTRLSDQTYEYSGCNSNTDCASNKVCENRICIYACNGQCGFNAQCTVNNHNAACSCKDDEIGDPLVRCVENLCVSKPCGTRAKCKVTIEEGRVCSCPKGMVGDPFRQCNLEPPPCDPNDCGVGATCELLSGSPLCTCPRGTKGDPLTRCVEILSTDEIENLCVPNPCATGANCRLTYNNRPVCSCRTGTVGNPLSRCNVETQTTDSEIKDACNPSPCGANSDCRELSGEPVCSCKRNFIGSPPNCREICRENSDCLATQACRNGLCLSVCNKDVCGTNAICSVVNHNPICACPKNMHGDPFVSCVPIVDNIRTTATNQSCSASLCGPNSECKTKGKYITCSCLNGFSGIPPHCRPECDNISGCFTNTVPDYPDRCYDAFTKIAYAQGFVYRSRDACQITKCTKDFKFIVERCNVASASTVACPEIENYLNLPYPECCNRYAC